jgi:hypothetical protein
MLVFLHHTTIGQQLTTFATTSEAHIHKMSAAKGHAQYSLEPE